jgi:hypothetical protein
MGSRLTLRLHSARSKTINSEWDEIIYAPPFASYEQEISLIPLIQKRQVVWERQLHSVA